MISYDPLWKTMKKKGISQYTLETKFGISTGTMDRLRKEKPITTTTMEVLCKALECNVEDIIEIK